MKSDRQYVDLEKAAEILDTSPDRVLELCADGLVRKRDTVDGILVRRSDVEEVKSSDMVGEMRPTEVVKRLKIMNKRVERLEGAIDLLFEINKLGAARFPSMTDRDLVNLHHNMETEAKKQDWPVERMLKVCDILIRLTEVEVDRLNNLLGVSNSWLQFFNLAMVLSQYVGSHPQLDTDIELQNVRDLLYLSIRNIREVGTMFIEYSGQLGPSRDLVVRTAAVDVEGFDVLVRQMINTCARNDLKIT